MTTEPKTYPLGDMPTAKETGGAPAGERMVLPSLGMGPRNFRAISTGEMRKPTKGEWYLSGAEIHAYKAPNDLSSAHRIAKLVRVELVPSYYKIVPVS